MTILHGECAYEVPWSEREDVIIAWGGVLAQVAVAIPLIILSMVFSMQELGYLRPVIVFLGYVSVAVAIVNLAPSNFLDGGKAWKIVPMLINSFGENGKGKKKKSKIRVVK